jgi:hypothetical protein
MREKYDPIIEVILSFIGNEERVSHDEILKMSQGSREDIDFVLTKLLDVEILDLKNEKYVFTNLGFKVYTKKNNFFNYDDILYYEKCGLDSFGDSPSLNKAGKKLKHNIKLSLHELIVYICTIILCIFIAKVFLWRYWAKGNEHIIDETFKNLEKETSPSKP